MSLSISIPTHISFSKTLTSQTPFLPFNFSHLYRRNPTTIIRMGGGPRTYPGGVSKWQWKRMQAKKAKQLLKARLARERQIYEMRKRAELKAAVSELERPWEVVRRAPTLFSVKADEQLKVLADRFQKPGGFDMWSERDGPQLFETPDGFPSARFFPKGVVHSVKPYGFVSDREIEDLNLGSDDIGSDFGHGDLGSGEIGDENLGRRNGVPGNGKSRRLDSDFDGEIESGNELVSTLGRSKRNGVSGNGKSRRLDDSGFDGEIESGNGLVSTSGRGSRRGRRSGVLVNGRVRRGFGRKNGGVALLGLEDNPDSEKNVEMGSRSGNGGGFRKQGNGNRFRGGLRSLNSEEVGFGRKQRGDGPLARGGGNETNSRKIDYRTGRRNVNGNGSRAGYGNRIRNSRYSKTEVFDLDLEQDGSYGFQAKTRQLRSENAGN
ncbi:DEA(D/H)-box RNA helicase family protein [Euphorbia peplus]|nr:DEA(D/H)-box RNA helicase family protein [Euphorbia peplus]